MDKYVIFDVDGTLNQTKLYALPAYQEALKKRNIEVSEEEIISCIGMRPQDIVHKLLGEISEEERLKWRVDIKEAEFSLMKDNACAFPEMKAVLMELKEKGYKTAICSNAYPNHIQSVLQAIDLEGCFDEIASLELGDSKAEVLKNLLATISYEKACLVGDRIFDIQAAKANNIPVIGCLYGYAPSEIMEADRLVKEPIEIIKAVEELLR